MYLISSFYHFVDMDESHVDSLKRLFFEQAESHGIKGLAIVANEGLNSTICGPAESIAKVKTWLNHYFSTELFFKDSQSEQQAFRRFIIKRKEEIVTTSAPHLRPTKEVNHHLSPEEWNQVLKDEKDFFLVDTRNWYETKIGTFRGAVDPKIDQFTEFTEFVESQELPKDKKILMFCTGGIRCEKGIVELQERGYTNVYQLEGGILNYLEQYPNDEFEGECFVFDNRVAVDQNLKPSNQYQLCPHTGQPAEIEIQCLRCGTSAKISSEIHAKGGTQAQTCSKNCAYHWDLNPGRHGNKQSFQYERPSMIKDKTQSS